MLHKTKGIVLRSVKYGDTSLIVTAFTETHGVQTYMVKGVRTAKGRGNKAAYFQSGTLLDLVVYMQPNKSIQHIREYQSAYLYESVQDNVIKNCILLFSVELLLRLLPEHAPLPELFGFAFDYLVMLDKTPTTGMANLPLYFMVNVSALLGYELRGRYSPMTPFLDLSEGGFSEHTPRTEPFTTDEDARALDRIIAAAGPEPAMAVSISGATRLRLIDWYVVFLQQHTQHMSSVRSLSVLRAVLH